MILVDTGAWIALLDARDAAHERAKTHYERRLAEGARLVTTNFVIAETATRLRYDIGLEAALAIRDAVTRATNERLLRLVRIDAEIERGAWRVLEQYRDVKLSLTDATSAVVARRMKVDEIFSFDADFRALGFQVEPAG